MIGANNTTGYTSSLSKQGPVVTSAGSNVGPNNMSGDSVESGSALNYFGFSENNQGTGSDTNFTGSNVGPNNISGDSVESGSALNYFGFSENNQGTGSDIDFTGSNVGPNYTAPEGAGTEGTFDSIKGFFGFGTEQGSGIAETASSTASELTDSGGGIFDSLKSTAVDFGFADADQGVTALSEGASTVTGGISDAAESTGDLFSGIDFAGAGEAVTGFFSDIGTAVSSLFS